MFTQVLVVCLIFVVNVAGYYPIGPYYPECPEGFPVPRVCAQFCQSDFDCGYGEFCCKTGCLITCLPRPKEGECPALGPIPYLDYSNKCFNDQDCPGIQKCCGPSYYKSCQVPGKPGSCPRRDTFGPCFAACDNDFDCPGNEKCCGSCPRICEKPCDHNDDD